MDGEAGHRPERDGHRGGDDELGGSADELSGSVDELGGRLHEQHVKSVGRVGHTTVRDEHNDRPGHADHAACADRDGHGAINDGATNGDKPPKPPKHANHPKHPKHPKHPNHAETGGRHVQDPDEHPRTGRQVTRTVPRSHRAGPDRRQFLAAAAAVGAGGAGVLVAGCDAPARRKGGTAASARPSARSLTGSAHWRVRSVGPPGAVQGYADKVSVRPGEEFGLYVSTTAPGFRVLAYRVGWYGGAQAALVWKSGRLAGRVQGAPRLTSATRTVRAGWTHPVRVRTDGWPEGAYLLRLEAENGHQRYVPLIVRSHRGAGRTVLMHAPATWQAYNRWGGHSLYSGPDGAYGTRSLAVSFDRPYDADGAEKFMVYERAVVVLAERLGIPLAYTTGVDVHRDPTVLDGATAAVSLGHDEYWTQEQRQHVTRARDAGTNLAFLGANTCFRRIRLQPGASGADRTVVCYKTDYRSDPGFRRHGGMATTDFRQSPAPDPESSLTGVIYEGYPTDAPYVVHSADHWLFAGTGVRRGDSFAHLVGVEYDRVTPGMPGPKRIEILAHSPLVCNGRSSHSDSAYYTVSSGAGVFASGTMRWVEGLMAGTSQNGRDHGMDARTAAFVTRTTENLLRAFAAGPAAKTKPKPRTNVTDVYRSTMPATAACARHVPAADARVEPSQPGPAHGCPASVAAGPASREGDGGL